MNDKQKQFRLKMMPFLAESKGWSDHEWFVRWNIPESETETALDTYLFVNFSPSMDKAFCVYGVNWFGGKERDHNLPADSLGCYA